MLRLIMMRREFLQMAGVAGISALGVGLPAGVAGSSPPPQENPTAMGLTTKPMERVRVGFIGVGARGSGHVSQMLQLDGVEVTAICDLYEDWAERSAKICTDKGRPKPAVYSGGPEKWKDLVQRDDVDIVLISTPWEDHVPMAVGAMRAGKHAFIEVPAATTVDGCWQLVEACESTRLHCMMMENVNYGREELMVLNMCRQGVFGELLHGEAAYIHDLRWQMNEVERGTGSWRTLEYMKRNGNLYPTHGLGPVAHYMGINRGDRLDFLSSVSSPSRAREIFAAEHFPEGHKWRTGRFVCGDINTTIAKTVLGKTLMIQWDEQLPRPYTRHNLVQGTKGVWGGFPARTVVEGLTENTESWVQGSKLKEFFDKFDHPVWTKVASDPANQGGHGGMDFVMLWRIVYCLRGGLPLDQDVYDAATWSVIGPLSEESVSNRGKSVDVPDFTRGAWKSGKPVDLLD